MKRTSAVLWGLVLIALGCVFAVNALGLAEIDIFFDGWWTLFIIIPCVVGLFTERDKTGNLVGIGIGVFLLLCCQDILSFSLVWKLLVPAVIVIVGIKMVLGGVLGNKGNEILVQKQKQGEKLPEGCGIFSGNQLNYTGQVFDGADLTAVFGGVDCDLRGAIIEKDCAIKVLALFGGIDIRVPEHVNVQIHSTSLFGGMSNKANYRKENTVTLHVTGTCLFGGVDVK